MSPQSIKSRRYYVTALMFVLAVFVIRLAMASSVGSAYAYSSFYPAIVLSAFLLGLGPAVFATSLSALIAFWCFAYATPDVDLRTATLPAGMFLLVSLALSVLLSGSYWRRSQSRLGPGTCRPDLSHVAQTQRGHPPLQGDAIRPSKIGTSEQQTVHRALRRSA